MKHLKRFVYGALVLTGVVGISLLLLYGLHKAPEWMIIGTVVGIGSYGFGWLVDEAIADYTWWRKRNGS